MLRKEIMRAGAERMHSQEQVTEQDPTALTTEYTKATKSQLLWFWHDYLVLAIQRLRNKLTKAKLFGYQVRLVSN